MAKGKSAKRNKSRKGGNRARKSENEGNLGLNDAICSIKKDGIKIEAICSLEEVSACVAQLKAALDAPVEETGTAAEAANP